MLVLTVEEIEQVTKKRHKSAQIKVLRSLGVPFLIHPTDHTPIVLRSAFESCLGYSPTLSLERDKPSIRVPKALIK